MNNEIIFQNNDTQVDNPFDQTVKPTQKFSLPSDKRILALIILGGIIVLLFIIALIVSATKPKNQPQYNDPSPTFAPTSIVSPTPAAVPTEFQPYLNQINLNHTSELPPPNIDDTIGL